MEGVVVVRDSIAALSGTDAGLPPGARHVRGGTREGFCFSDWQCSFLGNPKAVPAYIPESLVLASDPTGRNASATILGYMIRNEPFMFMLLGKVLQTTCATHGAVFVDSGANEGLWSLLAATHGCHVISVEPQPGCQAWIKASLALNPSARRHIHLWHHFLAADSNHTLEVDSESCNGGSSFSEATPQSGDATGSRAAQTPGGQQGQATRATRTTTRTTVTAARLDASTFLLEHGDSRISLWHLDTEGAEVPVLRSAAALFASRRIDRVMLEVTPHWWARYGVTLTTGYGELAQRFAGWRCVWACTGQRIDWSTEAARVTETMRKHHGRSHAGSCRRPWRERATAVDAYCVRPGVEPFFDMGGFEPSPRPLLAPPPPAPPP